MNLKFWRTKTADASTLSSANPKAKRNRARALVLLGFLVAIASAVVSNPAMLTLGSSLVTANAPAALAEDETSADVVAPSHLAPNEVDEAALDAVILELSRERQD